MVRRVVGSLTTLPKRIDSLEPTLRSIIEQTATLDAIYLNVPHTTLKGDSYTLPPFLFKEPYASIITVQRCHDYGSITKIIPTLDVEVDDTTLIITFDDDVIYKPFVVSNLLKGIERHPMSCVGISGWVLGTFPFNYELVKFVGTDREVDWLQGTHSVCYNRRFLKRNELLAHMDIPLDFHMQDDHILSFYVEKNGGTKYVVESDNPIENRESVRHIDDISGRSGFASQVADLCTILRRKGYYNAPATIHRTFGFWVLISATVLSYGVYVIYRFYTKRERTERSPQIEEVD
uniref:Glycosyltransferase 2-like domain-containing protein n=1 Tax=viral metagenome TaxID=1070528 RepID=A0A6C0LXT6_9ZZZZ